ncbi:Two component regulator propeller [Granulicella pectinivorans]|uniref:Two component regulator propeller n=1 Tax=Granulicella pectinivorans TaxID=474950 RepID=A0A1I6MQG4_9BACT|nr:sensor histidine kinase [Granulicella pectinivorans]SFS17884.1 Two component regulator propeller [Granulicella pectinivorans]
MLLGLCLVQTGAALDRTKSMSQYIHERWDAEKGFLGGQVHAIGESNDGYLWVGTERGLLRYDGFTFTLMQQPLRNAEPLGAIRSLVSDGEGNLWIRMDGPRLLRYRDGVFEDASAQIPQSAFLFSAMASDEANGMLLSGLGGGTFLYRNRTFETVAGAESFPGTVTSLAMTRDGAVWTATREGGLSRTLGGSVSNRSGALGGKKVDSLLQSNDGGLWVGTESGLLLLTARGTVAADFSSLTRHLAILALAKDRSGNLWIGTNRGLLRITASGAASFDLLSNEEGSEVTAVYVDHEGSLWYGGAHGIECLRDGAFTTYAGEQGVPHQAIGPLSIDNDGRTWFAPLSGGLYFLKDGHTTRITAAGLTDDVVYSISGSGDEVWVGRQRGGLTGLSVNGGRVTARTFTQRAGLAQNTVYSVHAHQDGTVWAGTVSAGVSRLKDGRFTNFSTANGLSSNDVKSIAEGHDGTMWFATSAGLDSFKDGRWTAWTARDGLPASGIESIYEDSKDTVWIATHGGLAYLSSGSIHLMHALPELLREQISGITEDGLGSLWFTTSDHVIQVNRDLLLSGSVAGSDLQSYGASDGLQGLDGTRRDRSMTSDGMGRIWISLNSRLVVADPQHILSSDTRPIAARIRSMTADGVDVTLKGLPKIAPGTRSITFTFASTSLSDLERMEFRYKLDGSDQSWSDATGMRHVIYKNLGPGTYRFRVIASSGGGFWNGSEASLPFVVDRAFWQTWWFQALCVTAFGLTFVLLYQLRVYRLTRQLNLNFQERLAERTRIAQELHDTLLQSFQGLMLRFQTVDELLPSRPLEAKATLDGALERADQAISEGRGAIQNIRSTKGSTSDLAETMNAMMIRLKEENSGGHRTMPALSLLTEGEPQSIHPLLTEEICRIGLEALRNSLLHANADHIETEITYGVSYLRLRFRDNGDGIDPETLRDGNRPGHWGIVGMKERAERIHAQFNLWSKTGAGTEVELKLSARLAYEASQERSSLWPFRRGSATRP